MITAERAIVIEVWEQLSDVDLWELRKPALNPQVGGKGNDGVSFATNSMPRATLQICLVQPISHLGDET